MALSYVGVPGGKGCATSHLYSFNLTILIHYLTMRHQPSSGS